MSQRDMGIRHMGMRNHLMRIVTVVNEPINAELSPVQISQSDESLRLRAGLQLRRLIGQPA